MKNIILLCLLTYTHLSFAQNWMPFRVGETYNYTNSTPDFVYPGVDIHVNCGGSLPNQPINVPDLNINMVHNNELQNWIDSIIGTNLDSVYHFNKKVLPYNSAGAPAISTNNDLGFSILNNTFVKNSLGQYIFHYNSFDSLMFDPTWLLNDSVVSDFSTGLIAKLVSIDFNTLPNYNILDSIKTINYYDNNNILKYQIVFTKNHGINSFQDISTNTNNIQQVGIESENLGTTQLTSLRIFDFNIGDKFYYQKYEASFSYASYTLYEVEILSKNIVSPDSIVYNSRETGWYQSSYPSSSPTGTFNSTHSMSVTHNKVYRDGYVWVGTEVNGRDNEGFYNLLLNNNSVTYAKNFLTDGNLKYKYISYSFGWDSLPYPPCFILDTSVNPYICIHGYNGMGVAETSALYAKGLGIVHKSDYSVYYDYYFCQSLIGYIKNNDTVGTIIPNHILLGIENPLTNPEQPQITIYPNPANENLTLELDKLPLAKYLQIDIIDLHGRVLWSQQKTPENSYIISLENLSNGLYLLQLKDEKGQILGLEKFVKQN